MRAWFKAVSSMHTIIQSRAISHIGIVCMDVVYHIERERKREKERERERERERKKEKERERKRKKERERKRKKEKERERGEIRRYVYFLFVCHTYKIILFMIIPTVHNDT